MTVKEWFERGRIAARELRTLREAKREALDMAMSITARPDKEPVQGGKHDPTAKFDRYVELVGKYDKALMSALEAKLEIEECIAKIDDVRYRNILRERYVLSKSWERIMSDMAYERTHIFRLHGEALQAAKQFIRKDGIEWDY